VSVERPEHLAAAGATASTTTTASFKQPEGQATEVAKPTTSKDVVSVASTEVPEQTSKQVSEQSAPE
jgi:hypothetical protein